LPHSDPSSARCRRSRVCGADPARGALPGREIRAR
jgi:hypothetical protein